jgi:hypothetical protein
MATIVNDVIYLPIGCSCINQFQLDFRFGRARSDSQIFDWSITTPDATIAILREKNAFITEFDDIKFVSPNILFSRAMPGYFIWHLNKILPREYLPISNKADLEPAFHVLVDKNKYQVDKFFKSNSVEVRCIWSNVQPNLKRSTKGMNFADFFLTKSRYDQIKSMVNETWANSSTWFVVRAADVDEVLIDQPDVVVLNLDRATGSQQNKWDFMGEENTFLPVWDRIQKIKGDV